MATIDEMCSVMRDFQRGRVVQVRPSSTHDDYEWVDTINPAWDWGCNEYRVKPEAREWWVFVPVPPGVFLSKEAAVAWQARNSALQDCDIVRVREVLE